MKPALRVGYRARLCVIRDFRDTIVTFGWFHPHQPLLSQSKHLPDKMVFSNYCLIANGL